MTNPQLSKLRSEVDRILRTDDNLMDITKPIDDAFLMSRTHLKDKILDLLATQRTSIIEELRSELPKKRAYYKYEPNSGEGWNNAIDLITEALNKLKEKM